MVKKALFSEYYYRATWIIKNQAKKGIIKKVSLYLSFFHLSVADISFSLTLSIFPLNDTFIKDQPELISNQGTKIDNYYLTT